jgi:hypothetical protein
MEMRWAVGLEVRLPGVINSDGLIGTMLEVESRDCIVSLEEINEKRFPNSVTRSNPVQH